MLSRSQADADGVRPLRAIPRDRLIDRAKDAIKDFIVASRLAPGDRLPSESDLARSLDVSRNIVRQAVSSLETLGMVRVEHGRGTYVADIASTDVFRQVAAWIDTEELSDDEFVQVRAIFDRGIFELVMERASEHELDQLEALAVELHDTEGEDELHRRHDHFHQVLLEATGNRFLVTIGTILYRFFWTIAYEGPHVHRHSWPSMREGHLALVRLLRTRRRESIQAMIDVHLTTSSPLAGAPGG